jgi:hypothetical protein
MDRLLNQTTLCHPSDALQLSLNLWRGVENGERKRVSFGVWNQGDSVAGWRVYMNEFNQNKANKIGICLKIVHIMGSTVWGFRPNFTH